jgi:hypothetical protein
MAGNLKASRRGFWNFFFGAGFAAPQAMMKTPHAAGQDGGDLLEALLCGQVRKRRVHHCDRLLKK